MTDLGQIYNKLELIETKINRLLEWKNAHEKEHKELNNFKEKTESVLYGVIDGMVARVKRLWEISKVSFGESNEQRKQ